MSEYCYGYHSVLALLRTSPHLITELRILSNAQEGRLDEIKNLAKENKISIHAVSRQELDKLLSGQHQGIIAICSAFPAYTEHDLPLLLPKDDPNILVLVLDGVQDPHNLGACLRTANAFGVNAVIVPKDRAVGLTPAVRKVACGAAEATPFVSVTNLARTLEFLKEENIWLVGMDADAPQNLHEINLKGRTALVLGAEGSGLRRLTKEHCDFLAKIPMQGSVSSLNVSVACGVGLYEIRR